MDVTDALRELGGSATRAQLLPMVNDRQLRQAVAGGRVIKVGHGHYQVGRHGRDIDVARALRGTLSHQSAALAHHWPVAREPDRPVVTVSRKRTVLDAHRRQADIRYADLPPEDVDSHVTTQERTLLDCLRTLPFDEALAIGDSALRVGGWTRPELIAIATSSPRTGRRQALRVAEHADPRAATPFESVVRAISLDVTGLTLVPQVTVAPGITSDLVDESVHLVVECDSWTYHAERSAYRRDQERYNRLVLDGWLVLRIGMAHAMDHPSYVQGVLDEAVRRGTGDIHLP